MYNVFLRNLNKYLTVKLALAFALFSASTIGLAAIADGVREGDTLRYDDAVLTYIHGFSSPALDTFFIHITDFGGTLIIGAATACLIGYLLYKHRKQATILVTVGVGGATVIDLILKQLFERTRPDLWAHLVSENGFSFPSGHSVVSSAFAFAVVAILWRTKWRYLAIASAAIYIVLIGISRLYLGVHYPTDVIGGWLTSLIWILLVSGIIYAHMHRSKKNI